MSLLFDSFGRQATSVSRRVRSLLSGSADAASARSGSRGGPRPPRPEAPTTAAGVWEHVMRLPYATRSPSDGYAYLVDLAARLFPAPAYYLYRADGDALTLEHADLAFERTPGWAAHLPGDVTPAILREPDLRLPQRAEHREVGPLRTWAGDVLCVPLLLDDDRLAGVLLGAAYDHRAALPAPDVLRAFSRAGGAAVTTLGEASALRERVRGLEAEGEVRRRLLGSALEARRFTSLLLDLAVTATGSEAGFVAVADPDGDGLRMEASRDVPSAFLEEADLDPGGLFTWPEDATDTLLLEDVDLVARHGIRSILAVPLVEHEAGEDRFLGVFALLNFEGRSTFADFSLTLLQTFADQVRLVLGSSRLLEAFTDRYLDTVRALADAYDVRSPYTHGHALRVADLAARLGEALGLGEAALDDLRLAGRIHDVGMCGIVTLEDGFQADFEHPAIGASMIEMLPVSSDVVEAVRTHHEWHNGWGFPNGLSGEAIPLAGRILAVAEFVVEAAAGNAVRAGLGAAALAEAVRERRGVQFDPVVADAYLDLHSPPTPDPTPGRG